MRILQVIIAGVLMLSGAGKLADADKTLLYMQALGVPLAGTLPLLAGVTVLELQLGLLLLIRKAERWIAGAALLLFSVFLGVSVYALAAGVVIDCGCLGPLTFGESGPMIIVRNGALFFMTVIIYTKSNDYK